MKEKGRERRSSKNETLFTSTVQDSLNNYFLALSLQQLLILHSMPIAFAPFFAQRLMADVLISVTRKVRPGLRLGRIWNDETNSSSSSGVDVLLRRKLWPVRAPHIFYRAVGRNESTASLSQEKRLLLGEKEI